jgi:hypothetical protein
LLQPLKCILLCSQFGQEFALTPLEMLSKADVCAFQVACEFAGIHIAPATRSQETCGLDLQL